jgi:hypothetical protein
MSDLRPNHPVAARVEGKAIATHRIVTLPSHFWFVDKARVISPPPLEKIADLLPVTGMMALDRNQMFCF